MSCKNTWVHLSNESVKQNTVYYFTIQLTLNILLNV